MGRRRDVQDQPARIETFAQQAEQSGQVALGIHRALDRDPLGEIDIEPLRVDPRVVGLLVGEHAERREALRRERLDDAGGLVPTVRRLSLRIDRAFEEGVRDHVADPRDRRVAPLGQRPALVLGHEGVGLERDDAVLDQLVDRVLDLDRIVNRPSWP